MPVSITMEAPLATSGSEGHSYVLPILETQKANAIQDPVAQCSDTKALYIVSIKGGPKWPFIQQNSHPQTVAEQG